MSDHDSHSSNASIIDEKSWQDKFLSLIAVVVLIGLFGLGYYWESLSLPTVHAEEHVSEK
jgi:hypothetical protein